MSRALQGTVSLSFTRCFGYRRPDTGLQLLRRRLRVALVPEDVEMVVRIEVTRLRKLRFLTREDDRLTQSFGVSSLPIRASIPVRQVNTEKARRLNLDT